MKLLFIFLFIISFTWAQEIDIQNINKKYLEHLVKIKIDSLRKEKRCSPLFNDSILYTAASHHSNYMSNKQKLTHFEKEIQFKSPQNRADFYGAKNYSVGENVIEVPFNSSVKNKKGKLFNTKTYNGLANSIVSGWRHSPGHYKNIITQEYEITGIAISINKIENLVYACQKFANVQFKFDFVESQTLFPYSSTKHTLINSFKDIPTQTSENKDNWGLKHDKLDKCIRCKELEKDKPLMTLTLEKNQFILHIENSEYVKQLINDKNDGFAVEIVEFNDYFCGNSEYYTKPSRRNKQSALNGITTKPLFREDLFKGYKKRKTKKNTKFLSFIIGADSIPFRKRFYGFKLDKFSSSHFKISLGRVPKNINGVWGYNLVYIQDKQICHIDYFTNYCGDYYYDYFTPKEVSPDTNFNYRFKEDTLISSITIPFLKNKSTYSYDDIYPFLETLNDKDLTIDSISITAYSSIEGDSLKNKTLQQKRAHSIINALNSKQNKVIKSSIKLKNSWEHFFLSLQQSKKWKHLKNRTKQELVNLVNTTHTDSLEHILEQERKAEILVYSTINLTDKNLNYYIKKRNKEICDSVTNNFIDKKKVKTFLNQADTLYGFTYKMVQLGKTNPKILANLQLPDYFNRHVSLTEKFIFYGYKYPEEFELNIFWKQNENRLKKSLFKNHITEISREFIYQDCLNKTNKLRLKKEIKQEEVEQVFVELELLKDYYNSAPENKLKIDILTFDLNFILINEVYLNSKKEKSTDAQKCIAQMISFYKSYNNYDYKKALGLAKLAVKYSNFEYANILLYPFMKEDEVMAYLLPLAYQHKSTIFSENYYQTLIKESEKMNNIYWCNMFFDECGIPFQAFDHEELRDTFCKHCMDKNKFILELVK